jgi:lipoate-protein ligase A
MKSSFERTFDISLIPGRLTEKEGETALQLVRDRYGNDDWNLRKWK